MITSILGLFASPLIKEIASLIRKDSSNWTYARLNSELMPDGLVGAVQLFHKDYMLGVSFIEYENGYKSVAIIPNSSKVEAIPLRRANALVLIAAVEYYLALDEGVAESDTEGAQPQ